MKPAPAQPADLTASERVLVDYWTHTLDAKGKPVACHVNYMRVGSISESEAIKRGYERDELRGRMKRMKSKEAASADHRD